MEITIARLNLSDAKEPIPDYGKGPDPYQAIQVHDYLSVSFLRQPAEVKAASLKTIQLFQKVYPETMAKKYFVNVPLVRQPLCSSKPINDNSYFTNEFAVHAVDVRCHADVHG